MNMSYRRAWLLVDEINKLLSEPAVTAESGGAGGGGRAILMPAGRKIIQHYHSIEGRLMEYLRSSGRCRNWAVRGKKRCRLHGGLSTGSRTPEGKARTVAAMVEGRRRLLETLKAEGKPVPWGRKPSGVNRSAAERQLAQASKQDARAQRDLKEFLSHKFRRQRSQARKIVKREVERLLAEHEEQRRSLGLPPLSHEEREAVIEGFRQRVVVPINDGSMPSSDIQMLQDLLRERTARY
jgi:hypothetical protein